MADFGGPAAMARPGPTRQNLPIADVVADRHCAAWRWMMVKITGYGPIAMPARPGRAAGAQGRFRLPGEATAGASSETRETAGAEAVTIAASLIALQETIAAGDRDREAQGRADAMLDELAALQRAMLGGGISPARLAALAALADQPGLAADRRLAEVVGAVSLRAKVELARLEMAGLGAAAARA
jgi:hypothetical protein